MTHTLRDLKFYIYESETHEPSNWPSDLASLATGASVSASAPPPPVDDRMLGWGSYSAHGGTIERARRLHKVWTSLDLDTRLVLRAYMDCPIPVPTLLRRALGELAGVVLLLGLPTDRTGRRKAQAAVDVAMEAWASAHSRFANRKHTPPTKRLELVS